MNSRARVLLNAFVLLIAVAFTSCGNDFKDISTADGKRALLEEANNLLTSSQCDAAIAILQPLYFSQYVDTEVRLVYASAYACKGGLNFLTLLDALANAGSDIWSALVLSNFSTGTDDKTANLEIAADVLRTTAKTAGSVDAADRGTDANMFMIFIQASKIATIIGPLGNANAANGNEQVAGWPATSPALARCQIASAIANLNDSVAFVSSSASLNKISSAITSICGGTCPTSKYLATCTVTDQAAGLAAMTGISSDWTGP